MELLQPFLMSNIETIRNTEFFLKNLFNPSLFYICIFWKKKLEKENDVIDLFQKHDTLAKSCHFFEVNNFLLSRYFH